MIFFCLYISRSVYLIFKLFCLLHTTYPLLGVDTTILKIRWTEAEIGAKNESHPLRVMGGAVLEFFFVILWAQNFLKYCYRKQGESLNVIAGLLFKGWKWRLSYFLYSHFSKLFKFQLVSQKLCPAIVSSEYHRKPPQSRELVRAGRRACVDHHAGVHSSLRLLCVASLLVLLWGGQEAGIQETSGLWYTLWWWVPLMLTILQ